MKVIITSHNGGRLLEVKDCAGSIEYDLLLDKEVAADIPQTLYLEYIELQRRLFNLYMHNKRTNENSNNKH